MFEPGQEVGSAGKKKAEFCLSRNFPGYNLAGRLSPFLFFFSRFWWDFVRFCWVFVRFLLDLIRVGWWSAHLWDLFRVCWDFVRVVWDVLRVALCFL